MMKQTYLLLVFYLLLTACEKDQSLRNFEGNYNGIFNASSYGLKINAPTEIAFANGRFTVNEGYKLGSGTYKIISNNVVEFKDENYWTAEFDWALLLSGEYDYKINGNNLVLTKRITKSSCFLCKETNNNSYQYKLKKK
ncbi:hypothetical protein [Pedobacter sp. SL55]|uniref:hypothetical protein n=1 Tax=Pedobacter sp. SL55 TaxID=2995161 RepID=UPI00226DBBEB|nr:hypothetical protein [Pedobacter sp. SL55]WAC39820.1 hypothetical protein OVA16_14710 [Pedobacter sp. SL55]